MVLHNDLRMSVRSSLSTKLALLLLVTLCLFKILLTRYSLTFLIGKQWHPEHFVCAKCEKPFHGSRHYEKRGLAYCEIHYHQLFGDLCFVCNNVIPGDGKLSPLVYTIEVGVVFTLTVEIVSVL